MRWDLRFTRITPTGRTASGQKTFTYALEPPGFGIHGRALSGTGTSAGDRRRPDGTRTSALRFATADRLSLLRRGSGFWRYLPAPGGVRFLTGYDYEPGWGRVGPVLDIVALRPVLGWMTAWSFDRLRLWIERDQDPVASMWRAVLDAGVRSSVLVGALLAAAPAVRSRLPRSMRTVLLLGGVAAVVVPTPATVPRAGRCLRRAPDRGSARTPGTLRNLAEPGSES